MSTVLRPASPADLRAVLALWDESGAEPTRTDDLAGLETLVAHDAGALIVAEEDGALIGSVVAAWDGWRGSVYRLCVAPDHRRRGLGRRLLEAAESHLVGRGARRLAAVVVEDDRRAMAFWRATGWPHQPARARFVANR